MWKKVAIQQYLDKYKRTNKFQVQEELEQSNETLLCTICDKSHRGGAAKCWQNEFQTYEEHDILRTTSAQKAARKAAIKQHTAQPAKQQ